VTRQRIALLHFTAPPAIGGVEALIEAQASLLTEAGCCVTVVVGSGEPSGSYRLVTIPELHPDSQAVRGAGDGEDPDDHPLVQQIAAALVPILAAQDQIWVHNAFTVSLNPFLTRALHVVHRTLGDKRWVAFCHDLSAASRYVERRARAAPPRVASMRYIVLSAARRQELASRLDIPDDQIEVIPPPLDVLAWLDVNQEARRIAGETRLLDRDIALLVPSKLLPHKRIGQAVEAAAELKQRGLDPLLLVTGAPSPHEPAVSHRLAAELASLPRRLGVEGHVCLLTTSTGRIPERRTVRDVMSLCDLVFLPSAEEGYGTPINEAIALRVPVLCSDIPAFREAGGDYATYTNVGDPETVAEQMMKIARTPSVTRRHDLMRSMARFQEAILELAL
jgi:glycosyltransferase involved in cell wall biosynthesis